MQPCAGCWAARRLLADPATSPASDQSIEAQQAHLERVLGATTIVLLVVSLSYIALTALYGCLSAARVITAPPDTDHPAGAPPATREDTKRALQGIPVRVLLLHQHSPDAGGGQDAEADQCAVCLAEYAAGDEVRVLPACRHGFHRDCVDRWLLTRAPTCPVCRAPVAAPALDDAGASKEDCATGHGDILVGVHASRAAPPASPVQ
uniref:Uncharacterized protein n=1 Tax=Avena sativa TaxID=4498 RepID=A0ACD5XZC0_AVESA